MTDLSSLIAKLEAATEGSRELSDEVLIACGWKRGVVGKPPLQSAYWKTPDGQRMGWEDDLTSGGVERPDPTQSLDAALTLVPSDCAWDVWGPVSGNAQLMRGSGEIIEAVAGNAILALCIAALKARAA